MKRTLLLKLTLLLFILTYLPTTLLEAQEISSLEIIPENITNNDEVLLIVTTSFPFLECNLDSVHIFYACGAFAFDGFYNTGFETGDCERTDTISLGMLPNGPYMISYRMYYLGWSQVDQVDTFITVGVTGIDHLTYNDDPFRIWPNPSHGALNFKVDDQSIDKISIRNLTGSFSKLIEISDHSANTINTISLLPGMYICTALRKDHPVSIKKLIVLE